MTGPYLCFSEDKESQPEPQLQQSKCRQGLKWLAAGFVVVAIVVIAIVLAIHYNHRQMLSLDGMFKDYHGQYGKVVETCYGNHLSNINFSQSEIEAWMINYQDAFFYKNVQIDATRDRLMEYVDRYGMLERVNCTQGTS